MAERFNSLLSGGPARVNLKSYQAELPLGSLSVGVDNIHHDVYLSQPWCEQTRTYLLELVRQITNLSYAVQKDHRPPKGPETAAWKRQLFELLQSSLTRAKYEKKIELDILLRVSVTKFITQEIANQFSTLLLEAKEWIRKRGEYFERSEQAHVMKARLAELQADRRNIYRQVGQIIYPILSDMEENQLGRARRALFGEEHEAAYEMLLNRISFVEGGRDDTLFMEQYVLLGNYVRDHDRLDKVNAFFLDFLRDAVPGSGQSAGMAEACGAHERLRNALLEARSELAALEEERAGLLRRLDRSGGVFSLVGIGAGAEETRAELVTAEKRIKQLQQRVEQLAPQVEAAKAKADIYTDDYVSRQGQLLNEPENAKRLFDAKWSTELDAAVAATRSRFLDELLERMEQQDLLIHILSSYELRNIYRDYCPPVHLQQLKKALVSREEFDRVAEIIKQYPARRLSLDRIEALSKRLRKYPRDEARAVVLRFAEDFMRLRRDLRNHERLAAAMERINLVRSERTREVSRMNNSLYEFLLPSEERPAQDNVVNHAVIKADVRGSSRITQDLLARGLNPATLFSLNFYEPVKRILGSYSAAKVFIEGDAMILAIFETESNRSHQRAVSKACALARQILAIAAAYNERPEAADLPRLELGVGIAFQGSAPTYWVDSDSRIMISRALNLSDRLSSCSKVARRLLKDKPTLFRLYVFQPGVEGSPPEEDEADEFLIRFNLNGIELNEEGFLKLSEEISLHAVEVDCDMPWGRERTTFFAGQAPVGEGLEPILLRRGFVRPMLSNGTLGAPGTHAYYEVCTDPRVFELVEAAHLLATHKS